MWNVDKLSSHSTDAGLKNAVKGAALATAIAASPALHAETNEFAKEVCQILNDNRAQIEDFRELVEICRHGEYDKLTGLYYFKGIDKETLEFEADMGSLDSYIDDLKYTGWENTGSEDADDLFL